MSMVRLNIPSVFIYGGSILPGRFEGKDVTVVDVFEGVGKYTSKKMTAHAPVSYTHLTLPTNREV